MPPLPSIVLGEGELRERREERVGERDADAVPDLDTVREVRSGRRLGRPLAELRGVLPRGLAVGGLRPVVVAPGDVVSVSLPEPFVPPVRRRRSFFVKNPRVDDERGERARVAGRAARDELVQLLGRHQPAQLAEALAGVGRTEDRRSCDQHVGAGPVARGRSVPESIPPSTSTARSSPAPAVRAHRRQPLQRAGMNAWPPQPGLTLMHRACRPSGGLLESATGVPGFSVDAARQPSSLIARR